MAGESSFDVVSKIDKQEVDNALNQAAKEISQRFDFRGTEAAIRWHGEYGVEMEASAEDRVLAVLDVFKNKLVKRQVSLKALDAGEPKASGKLYKIVASLQDGLDQEQAKKVTKVIRDGGPKGVKTQVQGDEVRVSAKKKDDLQDVMTLLKEQDFDFAIQFTNLR
ncbi:YajQ family cyclic di-GMP-binding protein [Actinobacteria bacterium YIM 96077]|uniref:Nucleotide-binding protein DPM12_20645 n=1 Tax=Phytoactinopolyspora halophila TaxID=1981511 RepID=A0A329QH74_9ACTN|nr:YajQ family cyclic di-GMP-binding protein [Phytoactinopolyspora halophila]AYY14768.1 YajQ family cyclic di-GMP-binding protein [Actinobacteria bacterium YIM 96077]RAW09678.1 YajQ family cyclic di-GMP-binding protein [Phytoactinopolyspora halophila]